MKIEFTGWLSRPVALVMSIVMSAGLLGPAASLAAVNRTIDGGGPLDRNGGEGDPLDSNDHGGSGDGDEDVHSDSAGGVTVPLIPALADGSRILLVPEFQGGMLVFRIIIVEADLFAPEE